MKRIVIFTQCFGNIGEQAGDWYDVGHHEVDFLHKLAEKKGSSVEKMAHVLLNAEEWDEIQEKLNEIP